MHNLSATIAGLSILNSFTKEFQIAPLSTGTLSVYAAKNKAYNFTSIVIFLIFVGKISSE